MQFQIPELSLVVLIGASSSGKSTFAQHHFRKTEIITSDECRALVSDDENEQAATQDAFDVLHYIAAKRLKRGKLTVIDATNVRPESRKTLLQLAREYHCLPVAVVLDLPDRLLRDRHAGRADRSFGGHVIGQQRAALKRSLKGLKREGFRHIHVLRSPEEVAAAEITRVPLWNNRQEERGPFDIIGDVHGCFDELQELLEKLGYAITTTEDGHFRVTPPSGRKVIFLGDLVDRGPNSPGVLRLVMDMVRDGVAFCVPGNHDVKLEKKLNGKNVQMRHGLAETWAQLESTSPAFKDEVRDFIRGLVSHLVLDGGQLVVAHAGLREEMQGRGSGAVRNFCLYGETTGEIDEFGLPVRYPWAEEYRGRATVVYGHTPVPQAEWLNHTIDIDTGCVFGGKLTALRYPERELVEVSARQVYAEPARPLHPVPTETTTAQQLADDVLDLADVTGKRRLETRFHPPVTIREENSIAALEVMSRFGANPRWLIYLPPTMSPSETSQQPGLLEHPAEAFQHYRSQGVRHVICEEKHMGSRAVVVLCRDEAAAQRRFGVQDEGIGLVYTRTGRPFFPDKATEQALLTRLRDAMTQAKFWDEFQTDWACLDTELMPWSAKAQALLQHQYAAVGAASTHALAEVNTLLAQAQQRGLTIDTLQDHYQQRATLAGQFVDAYRQYCWDVQSLDDYRLAPFHLLATEGKVHTDQSHGWHMETLARFCAFDPILLATSYVRIDTEDEASCREGIAWWEALTAHGGEGMVIKPEPFLVRNAHGLVQPAVKCRGREYLRIIYGPDYTLEPHLKELRKRGLGKKRSLALREFALGLEALERFVAGAPLRQVHECVFGVLALESEEVDPRL
ncbi:protein phosphatase [Catalinimonas alkaloidigena]|uniref:Protein phosphatase n=1 Tax=Catalinimonas alkaloidigena TaxID=1075417 RepID=A0A1G9T436_9BACT|nr:polynucleotide kinase-phosphatase [Catalinimonas alkaloidigena]SDM42410.1 protein phosphatase [Catalinimonas alkaloidigena]